MDVKFGSYIIDRKVAIGGMAEIYKAHTDQGYPVAIKKIHPDLANQEKFIQMFLDEVRIVANLEHPNIVQLLDFGLIDGAYYYAMEWIEGRSLTELIHEQRRLKHLMSPDLVLLMMIDICEGLSYAHSKLDRFGNNFQIIHRDISPPNIMISKEVVFKLTDFGIAQVRDKNLLTQPGIIRGKFSYMSPEQSMGKELDQRSDIFSVGIVMFEALTNSSLFLQSNEIRTLDAVRKAQVPRLNEHRKDVPDRLEKCLRKFLEKDLTKRFSSAAEAKKEMDSILNSHYPESSREDLVEYVRTVFPQIHYDMKTMVGMSSEDYRRKKKKLIGRSVRKVMSRTDEKVLAIFNKGLKYPNWFATGLGLVTLCAAEVLSFVVHVIRFGT